MQCNKNEPTVGDGPRRVGREKYKIYNIKTNTAYEVVGVRVRIFDFYVSVFVQ